MKHWRQEEGWLDDVPSAAAQRVRERRDAVRNFIKGGLYAIGILLLLTTAFTVGYMTRKPAPAPRNTITLRQSQMVCTTFPMQHCTDHKFTACHKTVNGRTVYSMDAC